MKYPLIALPLSTLLILTGCGGSSSGGDSSSAPTPPPPPPAPTVTVTAPANAIVGVAFPVAWSSTDTTSCSSTFANGAATSGTKSITEASAGQKTYQVTCTGTDGSTASGSAAVEVAPQATAEGLWQGTSTDTGGQRTVSGVVTKENNYYLTYSAVGNANLTGFFAGSGNSAADATGLAGGLNSNDLREFNFEGAETALGGFNGGAMAYSKQGADKSAFTLAGTTSTIPLSATQPASGTQAYTIDNITGPDPVSQFPGTTLTPTPATVTFNDRGSLQLIPSASTPKLEGTFYFDNYSIEMLIPLGGPTPSQVDISYTNRSLTISHPQNSVTWDPNTRKLVATNVTFTESPNAANCTDNSGTDGQGNPNNLYCAFVPQTSAVGSVEITFDDNTLTTYHGVAYAYQEVNDGVIFVPDASLKCYLDNPAHQSILTDPNDPTSYAPANTCANATLSFSGTVPNVAPTERALATTYLTTYENTAVLADISASYSGSAGVDSAIQTGTLDIAADGTTTGAENSGCTYAGTVTPHATGGNVYDVSLTFTSGGSCTYSGAFSGVATFDATSRVLTVTTVNAARDKGFLFTGVKP